MRSRTRSERIASERATLPSPARFEVVCEVLVSAVGSEDTAFLKTLVDTFLKHTEKETTGLGRHIDLGGSAAQFRASAHRLKSAFLQVGWTALSEMCHSVEKAALADDLEACHELASELITEYRAMAALLAADVSTVRAA